MGFEIGYLTIDKISKIVIITESNKRDLSQPEYNPSLVSKNIFSIFFECSSI